MMKEIKKNARNEIDLRDIDQSFRLRGAITPKREIHKVSNIFESLRFTTSTNTIVRDLEDSGKIEILAPFSQIQNTGKLNATTKFGAISNPKIEQVCLNPALKRMKFINNAILRLLLLAIIINFILILVL